MIVYSYVGVKIGKVYANLSFENNLSRYIEKCEYSETLC